MKKILTIGLIVSLLTLVTGVGYSRRPEYGSNESRGIGCHDPGCQNF